eukprot:681006-Rhodomonas_salina.1
MPPQDRPSTTAGWDQPCPTLFSCTFLQQRPPHRLAEGRSICKMWTAVLHMLHSAPPHMIAPGRRPAITANSPLALVGAAVVIRVVSVIALLLRVPDVAIAARSQARRLFNVVSTVGETLEAAQRVLARDVRLQQHSYVRTRNTPTATTTNETTTPFSRAHHQQYISTT